jgi:hypothetical protein
MMTSQYLDKRVLQRSVVSCSGQSTNSCNVRFILLKYKDYSRHWEKPRELWKRYQISTLTLNIFCLASSQVFATLKSHSSLICLR